MFNDHSQNVKIFDYKKSKIIISLSKILEKVRKMKKFYPTQLLCGSEEDILWS